MADRSIQYSDLWMIYKAGNENRQKEILHWLNLPKHLPIYTPDMQLEVLTGAPLEVLERKEVLKHIFPEVKKKLGLSSRNVADELTQKMLRERWKKRQKKYEALL